MVKQKQEVGLAAKLPLKNAEEEQDGEKASVCVSLLLFGCWLTD